MQWFKVLWQQQQDFLMENFTLDCRQKLTSLSNCLSLSWGETLKVDSQNKSGRGFSILQVNNKSDKQTWFRYTCHQVISSKHSMLLKILGLAIALLTEGGLKFKGHEGECYWVWNLYVKIIDILKNDPS